jgi:putative transposase
MPRRRFSDEQIIAILREGDAGRPLAELLRQHGVSRNTYYRWKAKFGGLEVDEARRLRTLEDENRRLKKLVADLTLDIDALRSIVKKKW